MKVMKTVIIKQESDIRAVEDICVLADLDTEIKVIVENGEAKTYFIASLCGEVLIKEELVFIFARDGIPFIVTHRVKRRGAVCGDHIYRISPHSPLTREIYLQGLVYDLDKAGETMLLYDDETLWERDRIMHRVDFSVARILGFCKVRNKGKQGFDVRVFFLGDGNEVSMEKLENLNRYSAFPIIYENLVDVDPDDYSLLYAREGEKLIKRQLAELKMQEYKELKERAEEALIEAAHLIDESERISKRNA